MDVIFRANLKPDEKLVLLVIDSLDRTERGCFASNEKIGSFIGLSESWICKTIGRLREKGLIEDINGDSLHRRVNHWPWGVPPIPWAKLKQSNTFSIGNVCAEPRMCARMKVLLFMIYIAGLPSRGQSGVSEGCRLTNQQLADRTGATKRSVDGDVRRMLDAGWLRAVGQGRARALVFDECGDPMRPDRRRKKASQSEGAEQ